MSLTLLGRNASRQMTRCGRQSGARNCGRAARLAIAVLLPLLVLQAATGVILAGTDLFWPPLGRWFAGWVAAAGIDPAMVSPLAKETMDQTAYRAMRAFRSPVVTIHLYAFYVLAGVILLHMIAVMVTEIHEGGSITSAMFTGRKILSRPPQDLSIGSKGVRRLWVFEV